MVELKRGLAILLLLATAPAQAFGLLAGQSANERPYLGQVITRAFVADQEQSLSGGIMEKGYGWTRDGVTTIQFGFANYYVDSSNVEQNPGNSLTLKFALYYSGTCVAAKFSGASSGTLSNGGQLLTDAITLTIPSGGKYEWYAYFSGSGQFVTRGGGQATGALKDTANGDAVSIGGSDVTATCGTVTDSGSTQAMLWPTLGIAMTAQPSALMIGDSRLIGYQDSYVDGEGFIGDVERSVGPYYAELNLGRSSTLSSQYVGNVAKRSLTFPYFSNIIIESGANDMDTNTAAQIITSNQAIAALLPGKPAFLTTFEPDSTSTDGWITTGNQTTLSTTVRNAYNLLALAVPAGIAGTFDLNSAVENGTRGSGIWKAPPAITPDGIHENYTGNLLVKSSGVIPPSAIHR